MKRPGKSADRDANAEEFVALVKATWDSFADDAVIDHRPGGPCESGGWHSAWDSSNIK
jgi:hypothetical protein